MTPVELFPCCGCCDGDDLALCAFAGWRDRHSDPCPVCEVPCPRCGDTHAPTKGVVVPPHSHGVTP